MASVASIVRVALLHLRVQDPVQPVKAVNMADGIDALNRMMTRWEADGITLGWQNVSSPSADLPVPPEAEEAVGYNLALRLRAQFGCDIDPDVVEFATTGLARLHGDCLARDGARLDLELPTADSERPCGDFYTGP